MTREAQTIFVLMILFNLNKVNTMNLQTLIEYFNKTKLTDEPIRLNKATVIQNQRSFVDRHVQLLLNNKGKRVFKPYYDRLQQLYLILNEK